MESKKKWSTKVRILTLLIIIVGILYWIVGMLQAGIISFFNNKKEEMNNIKDQDNKGNRVD